jgi:hypothetical protein
VAAFLSVGTDGTTYVSAAVSSGAPPSSTFKPIQLTCPF